jgi:HSP20 family protein
MTLTCTNLGPPYPAASSTKFVEDLDMAEAGTKLQVKTEENASERPGTLKARRPFQTLRRGIDQFLEDFQLDFLRSAFRRSVFDVEPFWQHDRTRGATPAVDIVEKDTAYEVTADLPGLEKKSIEVKVVKGNLTIKGGKQEIKEEQKKDYYLRERLFGSFERSFRIPESVDTDKIEASFKQGELTVTLPKKPEAQKPAKKINVKNA